MKLIFDLNKAVMPGKVQVLRTVNKGGKTFQQHFWVNSSDVKDTDVIVGGSKNSLEISEKNFPVGSKIYYNGEEATVQRVGKEFSGGGMGIVVRFSKGGTGTIGKSDMKNVSKTPPKKSPDKTSGDTQGESKPSSNSKDKTPDKAVGKTWSDTKTELGKMGYKVDSIFSSAPPQPKEKLTLYKDGKTYEAEVTKYHNGDYEILGSSIKEVKAPDKSGDKGTIVTNFKNGFVRYNPDGEKPPYHGGKTYKYFASRKGDATGKYFDSQKEAEDYVNGDDKSGYTPKDFGFKSGGENVAKIVNEVNKVSTVKKVENGNVGFGTLVLDNGSRVDFGYDKDGAYLTYNGENYRDVKKLEDKWSGKKSESKTITDGTYETSSVSIEKIKVTGNTVTFSIHNKVSGLDDVRASSIKKDKQGEYFTMTGKSNGAKVYLNDVKLGNKTTPTTDSSSTEFDMSEFTKLKTDRPKALQYLKDKGITWKETDNEGINWMRACMSASKASNSGASATKKDSTSKSSSDSKPSGKASEEAKKAVKDLLSANGSDRAKTMQAAKNAGVTWKESDNAGINWMRASLAIQKHYESGKSIDSPKQDDSTKTDNSKKDDKKDDKSSKDKNDQSKFDIKSVKSKLGKITTDSRLEFDIEEGYSNGGYKITLYGTPATDKDREIEFWESNILKEDISDDFEKFLSKQVSQATAHLDMIDSKNTPTTPKYTKDKPLVTSETKSGRPYQIWESGGKIYGSIPGKQDSRDARDIRDFSIAGFKTIDGVKDYIKKYF